MSRLSTSVSLLHRVRRMEPAAWKRFCQLYTPTVYSWCRRARLQDSDAADCTQDVFHTLFQKIGQFQGEETGGSFRGWIWAITTNQIRLHFRKIQNLPHAAGGSNAQQQMSQLAEAEFPETELDAESDSLRILKRGLDVVKADFSEITWEIFVRATMQGESYQQLAEEFSMSDQAVRQARYRVLRRLREELDGLI